ncbi:MAG: ATP-binding protein [Candidatus Omnitrophica bacterium]|nr:ATP-binding protein [Candidatus Omnitrophota bacterium]
MGETRVNLKHLLEDIRDSYPCPQEEAIITELIANALDSGASEIRFFTVLESKTMSVVDNGEGMRRRDLKEYHDIAATTKVRGKGIGFAGVGVKLALLVAEKVVTETKRGSFHKATQWRLEGVQRAPWEYVEPNKMVGSANGTAISIVLHNNNSELLKDSFIEQALHAHFYPVLDKEFMDRILRYVYKKGVAFFVNDRKVALLETEKPSQRKSFLVKLGKRGRAVGIGFLDRHEEELPEDQRGMAISTYGKVIKRGWDWVGVTPRNPRCLTGIVEIPQLSEILTTNKADFLKDLKSLKKYYRYRKAIQSIVESILQEFGETNIFLQEPEKNLKPLEKEIEQVLGNMLNDFPELSPLLGRRESGESGGGVAPDSENPFVGTSLPEPERPEGKIPEQVIEPGLESAGPDRQHEIRRRRAGLTLSFENAPERKELGWLVENTIWINEGHPAYQRAMNSAAENYHLLLSVAWVLSSYLGGEKSPQDFINQFLSGWGSV